MNLTDEQWAIADKIGLALDADPERLWSPSAMARKIRSTTGATYDVLPSGETGFYWANGVLLGSTLWK